MAKSDTRKRFEEKFRTEREAGNDTFEFDGKTYSTKLAPSKPKSVPLPPKRPAEMSEEAPAKTLPDFYKKYPDSLPSKYAPKGSESPSGQTEAQRVGRAVSDARSSVRRLVEPNVGMDTEAERGERGAAMAAIQRARVANTQAGNRADEGILPGSSYRRPMKKGGMATAKKSGVRGAGCAARGHGKMKVY